MRTTQILPFSVASASSSHPAPLPATAARPWFGYTKTPLWEEGAEGVEKHGYSREGRGSGAPSFYLFVGMARLTPPS